MRAAWFESMGPARDVLTVGTMTKPEPQPGEVLVRVKSSGVNPSDTKGRAGALGNTEMPFPRIIPHQDGAGIIEAVGEGVPASRIGECVWVFESQLGRPFGTAADYVTVDADKAVALGDQLSFAEASCLGVPALTAHRCVFADGPVQGKTVLVTGGSGAVGFYAVQFAKHGGAIVVATVSNDVQAQVARRAGADLIVNWRTEDVVGRAAQLRGAIGERSIDRIVEVAFGANLATSLRMLKPGGVIAAYSSDQVPEPVLPFWQLAYLDATVRFILVFGMSIQARQEAVEFITKAAGNGWLKHNIARTFPLESIAEAHELIETGEAGGKVVLELA